jgi:hypothetical protein
VRQESFDEGENMRKYFVLGLGMLPTPAIVLMSVLALQPGAITVVGAAETPLPEGHPKINSSGGVATKPTNFDFSKIVKPKGGKTVQEVYQEKDKLKGKGVTLRGKVVKYNEAILGTNWLHLRDGTGKEPANDLTVTTQTKAKVGDTVLVEGNVSLDKDLGSGYRYDVILEDAKVKVE